jgi:3-hydroxyacyl-CoA dehydrogenase
LTFDADLNINVGHIKFPRAVESREMFFDDRRRRQLFSSSSSVYVSRNEKIEKGEITKQGFYKYRAKKTKCLEREARNLHNSVLNDYKK